MTGPDCLVAHLDAKDGFLGGLEAELSKVPLALAQDRFKGRVEQAVHQRRRCPVAAASLAFVTRVGTQLELGSVEVDSRVLFEQ